MFNIYNIKSCSWKVLLTCVVFGSDYSHLHGIILFGCRSWSPLSLHTLPDCFCSSPADQSWLLSRQLCLLWCNHGTHLLLLASVISPPPAEPAIILELQHRDSHFFSAHVQPLSRSYHGTNISIITHTSSPIMFPFWEWISCSGPPNRSSKRFKKRSIHTRRQTDSDNWVMAPKKENHISLKLCF